MIGRKAEIIKMEQLYASNRAEFLAVTGRRRVGKTFLIDSIYRPNFCFSMTGIQNASMNAQLVNFGLKLAEFRGTDAPKAPQNWQEAFLQLKNHLKILDRTKKHVLFFDELPWINTSKSGFVQFLAHFWNDYLSKEPHFLLVICGSVTSWITKNIINDAGGLHNRVTESIHLYPFTLSETALFFKAKGFQFTTQEIAKIYMSLGGIPFYLENLRKGESFSAAIERICFAPNGILHHEYDNLFKALFNNAELHQKIVEVLANRQIGLTHAEILPQIGLSQATGSYQRAMEELILSDFVVENTPFGKKKKGSLLRLVDEYSIFYHRFIKPNKKFTPGLWQQLAESQSYKIWAGLAFETLCLKHIDVIKQVLGIGAVYTEIFSVKILNSAEAEGFQIDLLIDRKDSCINLCEIKFLTGLFTIDKALYLQLIDKRQRFIDFTQTKKQVFLTLITNHGIAQNMYSKELVDVEIQLSDLLIG